MLLRRPARTALTNLFGYDVLDLYISIVLRDGKTTVIEMRQGLSNDRPIGHSYMQQRLDLSRTARMVGIPRLLDQLTACSDDAASR